MPFVVYLIGDYVVEIVASIAAELTAANPRISDYRAFAHTNKSLIRLVRERARSYWNCNYRDGWPSFDDYPATPVLDRLGYRRYP